MKMFFKLSMEKKRRRKETEKKKENKRENVRQKHKLYTKHYTDLELETEWSYTLHEKKDNIDKTFRILSLKYHPDKNGGQLQWALEKQKQLGLIKEFYKTNYFCGSL